MSRVQSLQTINLCCQLAWGHRCHRRCHLSLSLSSSLIVLFVVVVVVSLYRHCVIVIIVSRHCRHRRLRRLHRLRRPLRRSSSSSSKQYEFKLQFVRKIQNRLFWLKISEWSFLTLTVLRSISHWIDFFVLDQCTTSTQNSRPGQAEPISDSTMVRRTTPIARTSSMDHGRCPIRMGWQNLKEGGNGERRCKANFC